MGAHIDILVGANGNHLSIGITALFRTQKFQDNHGT